MVLQKLPHIGRVTGASLKLSLVLSDLQKRRALLSILSALVLELHGSFFDGVKDVVDDASPDLFRVINGWESENFVMGGQGSS